MDGTILDVENINRYLINKDCRKIVITPKGGKMRICIDGEIINAGKTTFEIIPDAFSFVCENKVSKCQLENEVKI